MRNITQKAKKIRLAIFDVDGVMTNGTLIYGNDGNEQKHFHVHDGLGMKLLQETGIHVAVITAKNSDIVTNRMQHLGIPFVYQGNSNKLPAYEELKKKLNLTDAQICYMGDDVTDLPLLCRVGLSITVPNAPKIIRKHAEWITQLSGGNGAVREVCDFLMQTQKTFQPMMDKFLQR